MLKARIYIGYYLLGIFTTLSFSTAVMIFFKKSPYILDEHQVEIINWYNKENRIFIIIAHDEDKENGIEDTLICDPKELDLASQSNTWKEQILVIRSNAEKAIEQRNRVVKLLK